MLAFHKSVSLRVLVIVFIFYDFPVFAQKKLPVESITILAEDQSIAEILKILTQKSGLQFSFNPKRIDVNQRTNYSAINKSLSTILNELAEKFGWSYDFVEDQIVLKPDKKTDKAVSQTVTLSGFVKDANTGEALIGSTLLVKELQVGVVCNAFGFYSITIPKGMYTIQCSFVGYKELTTTLDLTSSVKQDITLAEEPPLLKEVIVEASSAETGSEFQVSSTNLRPKAVEQRPALFGEMEDRKSVV